MATNQAVSARPLHQARPLRRALAVGAALAIGLALAIAVALAAVGPGQAPGIATDRGMTEVLAQVRRDEREERFSPSVDQIRRALIEFRASEREEQVEP